jgi:hypothetical protein
MSKPYVKKKVGILRNNSKRPFGIILGRCAITRFTGQPHSKRRHY